MNERLELIEKRYNEINGLLVQSDVLSDINKSQKSCILPLNNLKLA